MVIKRNVFYAETLKVFHKWQTFMTLTMLRKDKILTNNRNVTYSLEELVILLKMK